MWWLIPTVINAGATIYAAYKKGEISEEEYNQAIAANNELERKLKALRPDETWEDINPQLLSEAAKYNPDIAAFVQENAPELIQEAKSGTEKRVQRQALQKLAAQAETGRDVISEAQREQALYEADARSKQRQQALLERMRQQGMLGSGAALAAQLQTEQATAQEARQESLRGVQEAEMRRRQSLGQAAELAGQMRQSNLNVESSNVQTMNAYNQRLANARNLYNQYASGARNEAQLENQRREIARQQYNLGLTNKYALYNREQREAAADRARQFDVDLLKGSHANRQKAEAGRFAADRQFLADMTSAITSTAGVGLQSYGIQQGMEQAAAKAASENALRDAQSAYLNSLGQGAVQGAAQGLTSSAVSSSMPQPRYNLGVDYNRPDMYEDVSNESYDLGGGRMESQPSATRSTYESELVYDPDTDRHVHRNKIGRMR